MLHTKLGHHGLLRYIYLQDWPLVYRLAIGLENSYWKRQIATDSFFCNVLLRYISLQDWPLVYRLAIGWENSYWKRQIATFFCNVHVCVKNTGLFLGCKLLDAKTENTNIHHC